MIAAMHGVDFVVGELFLFAGIGLLIGGLDDLLLDACYIVRRLAGHRSDQYSLADLPPPKHPGRIVVFVAAWDEAAVIGAMLSTALARVDHRDYRIYCGVYPNDPGTIAAASAVAGTDPRVRLVVGTRAGPTTKADCLNTLWRALLADEAAEGIAAKAVVLHDAEDMVHAAELSVFDTLIEGRAVVQLPVVPLVKPGARLVSGHYADEFAESHLKNLVVRTALGAGMPLAGTGCAIAPTALRAIAAERGGDPFDPTSLTEDYELGLRIAELGGKGLFARVAEAGRGSAVVAVRAYFPATIPAATRQKARWMTGIAFAGWDRTGWHRPRALSDHWMRMRDRRAPIAVLVLAMAYGAIVGRTLAAGVHALAGVPLSPLPVDDALLVATSLLLGWRLAMRAACTWRCYGPREAAWSLPRFFVGNIVSLVAAPMALGRYWSLLRGAALVWDKTRHEFPTGAEAAAP